MHITLRTPTQLAPPQMPRLTWTLSVVSVALYVIFAGLGFVDPRLIEGVPIWEKPAKFALSFSILFPTLALMEDRLSPSWRDGGLLRATTVVMAVCFIVEMGYMTMQAGQAQASHFNLSTAFNTLMYSVMGVGAVLLILGVAVFGIVSLLDKEARLAPALRSGIVLGCILSFVLTLVVAGYMSSSGSRFVGHHPEGAPTLPLVGWSMVTGDLRPAHFLSLHAMQALPLIGLAVDRFGPSRQRVVMGGSAVIYCALTFALFAQALAGYPLIAA